MLMNITPAAAAVFQSQGASFYQQQLLPVSTTYTTAGIHHHPRQFILDAIRKRVSDRMTSSTSSSMSSMTPADDVIDSESIAKRWKLELNTATGAGNCGKGPVMLSPTSQGGTGFPIVQQPGLVPSLQVPCCLPEIIYWNAINNLQRQTGMNDQ